MFKRSNDIPSQVAEAGLNDWYSGLDDQSKIKLKRYVDGSKTDSRMSFFITVMDSALTDENYGFAVFIGENATKEKMNDLQRFILNEHLIEAYIGTEDYDKAKATSHSNLDLYPKVKADLIAIDGKVPEKMNCRNRLIDVMVGVESDYDGAYELLDRFYEMGLISEEDLNFRRQSLKVHRLQRTFDGVYTYRPKE